MGSGLSETSGNTLVVTTTAVLQVLNSAIITIAFDNTATTDGDHAEVSSVTDSAGNTYVKLHENTNGNGAAGAGVTISAWLVRATTQLPIGGTITINFANTITARAASSYQFSAPNALTVQAVTQDATDAQTNWGSLTISGLPSREYLFYRALAKESGTSGTQITPTSGYTVTGNLKSGVGANTSVAIRGEFKIATTTSETSNPVLAQSADNASVFVALYAP